MSTKSRTAYSGRSSYNPFSLIFWLLFLLVVGVVTWRMVLEEHAQTILVPTKSLPVLKYEVLRYHFITEDDVMMKVFNLNVGSADAVGDVKGLIGHYTLSAIDAYEPINKSQIGPKVDQNLIMKTLAIAIPANSAMPVGPPVHAGDIVSVASVPLPDKTSGPVETPVVVFDKVLVLEVNTVGEQTVTVLAIPSSSWLDYLEKTRNATIMLSYPVG